MDFPLRCQSCGCENWVDLENPILAKIDKIAWIETFDCQFCEAEIKFFYNTKILNDALLKLRRYKPKDSAFLFVFAKTLQKAIGIRSKHGSIKYPNETLS